MELYDSFSSLLFNLKILRTPPSPETVIRKAVGIGVTQLDSNDKAQPLLTCSDQNLSRTKRYGKTGWVTWKGQIS